jgi:predicted amidophosphoribosyltransferase
MGLMSAGSALYRALQLPSQCAVCRSWPSQRLCQHCRTTFAATKARCPLCALVLTGAQCLQCLRSPLPLTACWAAVDYAYPWSELLARYKFEQDTGLGEPLVDLLLHTPGVGPALADLQAPDYLVPLPLSAQRLAERGYNQAWELCRRLHRRSRCRATVSARLLLRLRHTQAQSELPRCQAAQCTGRVLGRPTGHRPTARPPGDAGRRRHDHRRQLGRRRNGFA